jgi:hypothetical protein
VREKHCSFTEKVWLISQVILQLATDW